MLLESSHARVNRQVGRFKGNLKEGKRCAVEGVSAALTCITNCSVLSVTTHSVIRK